MKKIQKMFYCTTPHCDGYLRCDSHFCLFLGLNIKKRRYTCSKCGAEHFTIETMEPDTYEVDDLKVNDIKFSDVPVDTDFLLEKDDMETFKLIETMRHDLIASRRKVEAEQLKSIQCDLDYFAENC